MIVRSLLLCACALALALVGCSKSSTSEASSDSSSNIISSPFKSSSGDSDSDNAYRRDVHDYAARFGGSAGNVRVFERDLGAIAEDHGILDWEHDDATYRAIGSGFATAGVAEDRFRDLASELADGQTRKLALIYQGYAAQPTR